MFKIFNNERRKVTLYSVIIMSLTSVHHAYGAAIYNTPWRLHVLFLSMPGIIITLIINRLLNNKPFSHKSYALRVYWIITLLAPILLIGIFEGIYNHILKNILFFSGFAANIMQRLFPSGTYEMPDNLFFEITGMLQGILAIPLTTHFIKLTQLINKQKI